MARAATLQPPFSQQAAAAGVVLPADVRLLRAKNLRLIESALTGESAPVEKEVVVKTWRERPALLMGAL